MLTFNSLLEANNIAPKDVAVMRHSVNDGLEKVFPLLLAAGSPLVNAWQSIQSKPSVKERLRQRRYLASFFSEQQWGGSFIGFFEVMPTKTKSANEIKQLSEYQELLGHGMTPDLKPGSEYFELVPVDICAIWRGKLIIDWPRNLRVWSVNAEMQALRIRAILENNRFDASMPEWSELILEWRELQLLPQGWRSELQRWRAIYYIYDVAQKLGYVGSASGDDNLLGRWKDYANTVDGGNVRLRNSKSADLRFSILERLSPDQLTKDVKKKEECWMRRLHTRAQLNG